MARQSNSLLREAALPQGTQPEKPPSEPFRNSILSKISPRRFFDGRAGRRLSPALLPWGGKHPLRPGRNVSRETFTRSDPRQKSPRAGAFHSVADHIVDDINPAEQAVENGPAHRMPCGKADDHGQRAAEGNPFFDGLTHRLAHFLLPGPGLLRSLRRGSLVRLGHNVAPFRLRRITPAASF